MVVLKFDSIKDVNAHKEIVGFKKWCKDNKSCLYKSKIRKYHGWTHLDKLKENGTIQCGYHTGNCNTKTVKGIGGYRNTCPIGGYNGDYPGPAKLQISKFNLQKNNITSTSKINSITVSFYHRMNGIGTKTGNPYYGNDNSPNFGKNAVKVYFTNGSEVVSEVFKFGNPNNKSDRKFTHVTCEFKKVSIEDVIANNFALNIEYHYNINTNPGIIYLKKLKVDVDYKNSAKYIEGVTSSKNIYISDESICRTNIIHTVEAGYKNGKTKISVSKAPQKLGSKIKCISAPKNVTVTQISANDLKKEFKIIDKSNIEGKKEIKYALSDDSKTFCSIPYQAIKKAKPSYSIVNTYKANEDFNPNKPYIIFKDGCASSISIFIDSIDSDPLILNVSNQNSSSNLLDTTAIESFHSTIKNLSCGIHSLFIKRGNESINEIIKNKVNIEILPMNFKFSVYTNENPSKILTFRQNKDSNDRYSTIIIKRIDDEPIEYIPQILIKDETQPTKTSTFLNNVAKNQEIEYTIDKYYSGDFKFILQDTNTCKGKNNIFNINIESNHKQNYDYLFTRAQDGTTFDFDYLVAWEGDNIKEPILIDSIDLKHSKNDIRICSNPSQTGLSQIGTIDLKVTNKTDSVIQNIPLELNVLKENDDNIKEVTTEEWTSVDGIFNQFYQLFFDYNENIKDTIDILNLTPDNDLVDEENVFLFIKQIEANNTISIKLPFRSTSEKTVFLQYLFFEDPLPINSILNCSSEENDSSTDIQIDVYDSMLTDLEIIGNTDLLSIDHRYPCPDECYTTVNTDENGIYDSNLLTGGITYKITNIDSGDFENQSCQTQIVNDNELIPYAYISKGQIYNLIDNNGNKIDVKEDRYLLDLDGNIIYDEITSQPILLPNKLTWIQDTEEKKSPMINYNIKCIVDFPSLETKEYSIKTNKNGMASFYIPIPTSLNQNYTIEGLLQNVVCFKFDGNYEYNKAILTKKENIRINTDLSKNKTTLEYTDNFRRYHPGEIAIIPVTLYSFLQIAKNYFIFNAELKDNGNSDEITILYKICNIKNNEGIFKTTFKTNDKKLVKNEVSKNIYCGLGTKIITKAKIDKKIVENYEINVININVENIKKENHDVEIQINLGKHPLKYLGRYDFLDINIETGDYSIIDKDGDIYISWLIGDMKISEKQNAIIKIKAKEVGVSDIKINVYDYLHKENSNLKIKDSICKKCEEETKWRFENSQWKSFNGIMYKLFPDGKYKRRINGVWVNKK